jgi:hypothetical protein
MWSGLVWLQKILFVGLLETSKIGASIRGAKFLLNDVTIRDTPSYFLLLDNTRRY